MKTFEINSTYKMNWITDSQLKTFWTVISRTAKTVTVKDTDSNRVKRCKINIYDNSEFIYPEGKYSMAPVLKASNLVINF